MPGNSMSGRRKTPSANLILSGSKHGKDRKSEPAIVPVLSVTAPSDYSAKEREIFGYYSAILIQQQVLSLGDIAILDTFVRVYSELLELEEFIRTNGRTYTAMNGLRKLNPECNLRNEARRQVKNLGAALGLSPSSRAGVTSIVDKSDEIESIT